MGTSELSVSSLRTMDLDEVSRKQDGQEIVVRLLSAARRRSSSKHDLRWPRWLEDRLLHRARSHGLPASGCGATRGASIGAALSLLAAGTSSPLLIVWKTTPRRRTGLEWATGTRTFPTSTNKSSTFSLSTSTRSSTWAPTSTTTWPWSGLSSVLGKE